jgi:hypothetical protein
MKTTYFYSVSMLGFIPVQGIHSATRSHDAEMEAVKHFMAENDIEKGDEKWSELIRFYAPAVSIATVKQKSEFSEKE